MKEINKKEQTMITTREQRYTMQVMPCKDAMGQRTIEIVRAKCGKR